MINPYVDGIIEKLLNNKYKLLNKNRSLYFTTYYIERNKSIDGFTLLNMNAISCNILEIIVKKNHFVFIVEFPYVDKENSKDLSLYINSSEFLQYNRENIFDRVFRSIPDFGQDKNIYYSFIFLDNDFNLFSTYRI